MVNPYNFVSLEGQCDRTSPDSNEQTYTGVMECSLETLAPLFIPRKANDRDTEFFSYDHKSSSPRPIIPGSSIRGVVRSVYEALTNSCLSTADDENVLYRRTNEPKESPGFVRSKVVEENGKRKTIYELYEAERVMLNSRGIHRDFGCPVQLKDYKTGQKVFVRKTRNTYTTRQNYDTGLYGVEAISNTPQGGYIEGYVLIGEEFGRKKHHDSVFVNHVRIGELIKADYDNLVKVWHLYQTKANGGVNEGRGTYDGYLNANPLPVFFTKAYQDDKGRPRYYLSPACISKEVFMHTISGILKTQGEYQPCNQKSGYCEACRLFGIVDGDGDGAIASRVMFHDANPVNGGADFSSWYGKPRQIILGSPKTTATEFYQVDAGGAYYNYDYKVEYNNRNAIRTPIAAPKLRGRKFYWHSANQANAPEGTNANMANTIHPINSGNRFTFRVSFDRVTSAELKKLKFALGLPFGDQHVHAHKLGHGKPIGYGSVKIAVRETTAYAASGVAALSLSQSPLPDLTWIPSDTTPVRELQKMTDWDDKPADVRYPVFDGEIYRWFAENKNTENGWRKPTFTYVLPTPLANDLDLPNRIQQGRGNRRPARR
jgi:CRISPR-associated protein (TIGR03986 family)